MEADNVNKLLQKSPLGNAFPLIHYPLLVIFNRLIQTGFFKCVCGSRGASSTLPTCEQAEGAARPLVQIHVVGVNMADQDAVVVVV